MLLPKMNRFDLVIVDARVCLEVVGEVYNTGGVCSFRLAVAALCLVWRRRSISTADFVFLVFLAPCTGGGCIACKT